MLKNKWSHIIIGTGMGGGSIGLKLAQAGHTVLFIEKGQHPTLKGRFAEEFKGDLQTNLKKAGRWNEKILDATEHNRKSILPFMGRGVGGSSALYGMVLERFKEADFKEWPVSYAAMEKYYTEAEKLFQVEKSAQFSHPAHATLSTHFNKLGFETFMLPLARKNNSNCGQCQSYQCQNNCKNHSGNICIQVAIDQFGAELMTECEVLKICMQGKKATGVVVRYQNQQLILNGENIIVAAGALVTPLLLMDSGIGLKSGMLGRNLMRHFVDLYALKMDSAPEVTTVKELGVDFKDNFAVQSFGRLPPVEVIVQQLLDAKPFLRPLKFILKFFFHHVTKGRIVMASILEDKPQFENRVWRDNGAICISYRISADDNKKIKSIRKMLKQSLNNFGLLFIASAEKNEMLAHVCGTARMGIDSETSVVDCHNKVHETENVYVVDSSFFPTSGSTNPALTIAANALRVAELIIKKDHTNSNRIQTSLQKNFNFQKGELNSQKQDSKGQ